MPRLTAVCAAAPAPSPAAGRPRAHAPVPVPAPAPSVRPPSTAPPAPAPSQAQRAASLVAAGDAVARTRALAQHLTEARARIVELESELAALRPPPPPPPPTTTTILYKTGWPTAFAHLSADGGPWADVPLPPPSPADGVWRSLTLPTAGRVRVVFTDGAGAWDSPDPYGSPGSNYVMDGGGVWTVRRGRCARVQVPDGRGDGGEGGWGWVE